MFFGIGRSFWGEGQLLMSSLSQTTSWHSDPRKRWKVHYFWDQMATNIHVLGSLWPLELEHLRAENQRFDWLATDVQHPLPHILYTFFNGHKSPGRKMAKGLNTLSGTFTSKLVNIPPPPSFGQKKKTYKTSWDSLSINFHNINMTSWQ